MTSDNHSISSQQAISRIVLFDGICNLCTGSVKFIINRDPLSRFRFASLQSEAGKKLVQRSASGSSLESLVYLRGNTCFRKSAAVLHILKDLGGVWKLLYMFILVPRFLRDFLYDRIAKNRYKLFGKRQNCMVPTPDLSRRFL